ncbi:MAG: hypothetical protein FWC10_04395 [Lentimicrobiaceae bacterium]|nr:hypothetical protein [Lentimicrobiaceae bacterium]
MKQLLVLHKYILIFILIFLALGCEKENSKSDFNTSVMVDGRDGQMYKIVKIGEQWWMAENLNYNTPTGSWYYNNDSINYSKPYGRLYLWEVVMNGSISSNKNPSGVRGISPKGWHIPSVSEWEQLYDFLTAQGLNADDLKEAGTEHWLFPNAGTNKTNFTAIPTGTVYNSGNSFANIDYQTTFLTSTLDNNTTGVWGYGIDCDKSNKIKVPLGLQNGWSIRCVKDK